MIPLPEDFLSRLKSQTHLDPQRLVQDLDTVPSVSIRRHPLRPEAPLTGKAIPWCERGMSLDLRPSFITDPAWHAGAYYVQEANSMALCRVLEQWEPTHAPLALDLCAAPGGKATLALDRIHELDGFLVANEPISKRNSILRENLVRWGYPNMAVTKCEVDSFVNSPLRFDLILLDAPCSGEGMFRKDPVAREHWSLDAAENCSLRSKEILEGALKLLRPGGMLIYSTCTFNPGENELLLEEILSEDMWVKSLDADQYPGTIPVDIRSGNGLYFLPGRTPGEGLFLSVIQKEGQPEEHSFEQSSRKKKKAPSPITLQDFKHPLKKDADLSIMDTPAGPVGVPSEWTGVLSALKGVHVTAAGVLLGKVVRDELKWDETLAHSLLLDTSSVPTIELGAEQALDYLRGQSIRLDQQGKGYVLIEHEGHILGAAKGAGNRLNNLYPQGWRIKNL